MSSTFDAIAYVDSLSANEFAVEIDGERLSGVFRISGLTPFKLDLKPSLTKPVREPFRLSKMVQRDPNNACNRWVRETVQAKADIVRPTRSVAIIAIDDGVEIRRWTAKNAFIGEISYSDFSTATSEMIEETLTIHYDDIEETWS